MRASSPATNACWGWTPAARNIGLALSDVRRVLASPFGTLRRGKLADNAAEILRIAKQE